MMTIASDYSSLINAGPSRLDDIEIELGHVFKPDMLNSTGKPKLLQATSRIP